MDELKPGLIGEMSQTVTPALTAVMWGSGLVTAYATPALVALMEQAGVVAIQNCMRAGQTSVGVAVSITHIAATPVGMRVRARAEVIAVEGRRVTLKVEAWDDQEQIGAGTHTRVVIDAARFAEKLAAKTANNQA